ncbi:MAG TPA: O-antigen ligase family protein [Blastocatellia bacterium]|nr:O-antigen ligase family protein [Blastocatellia bacterium]
MMSNKATSARMKAPSETRTRTILYWVCVSVLALTPLVFSPKYYRTFVFPKFAILVAGSGAILFLLSQELLSGLGRIEMRAPETKHVLLVSAYIIIVGLSTFFGVVPRASLFGSYPNQMGFITRLCFFVCFAGLIVSIGSAGRLLIAIQAMAVAGFIVSVYGVMQFFGKDPILSRALYTFNSPAGPVVRIPGTLGHSNYLGNFLLYTTPLTLALGITFRGSARRLAFAAVGISVAAIAFSGTRGAWLGLLAAAITFLWLELRAKGVKLIEAPRRTLLTAGAGVVAMFIIVLVVALTPASHNIVVRARSIVTDRFTGAGRTLLWRDALGMVPEFSLIGCGPEAFNRVFPAHRSLDLAKHAALINNESPHNSYLEAAISFGLIGAILYVAMAVSTMWLLLRSRHHAANSQLRLIAGGMVAAFVGVLVHNVFIYDQIPTGLYFFAFMAIALVLFNMTKRGSAIEVENTQLARRGKSLAIISGVVCMTLAAAGCWYVLSLARAEVAIEQAFASAKGRNLDDLMANGERAAASLEPTGAYDFLYARALSAYADGISKDDSVLRPSRVRAIQIAESRALNSLQHSFTPGSNYLLLAYLALVEGNREKLDEYSSEALRLDPNYYNAHWLRAEARLAAGDRERAIEEARRTLELRPGYAEALSILARARGEAAYVSPRVQGLVERARLEVERGRLSKAAEYLLRAIQGSNEPCPVCHRELALVYESQNKYSAAIDEWREYARESPADAAADPAASRITRLEQK